MLVILQFRPVLQKSLVAALKNDFKFFFGRLDFLLLLSIWKKVQIFKVKELQPLIFFSSGLTDYFFDWISASVLRFILYGIEHLTSTVLKKLSNDPPNQLWYFLWFSTYYMTLILTNIL